MNKKIKSLLTILFIFSMMITGCDPFGSSTSNDTTSAGGNGGGGTSIIVNIDPSAVTLQPGGTQQFKALITGSGDAGVTWSLETSNSGTISSNGFYTAPQMPGIYYVIATSAADSSKSAKASVVVSIGSNTYDSTIGDTTKTDSTTNTYYGTITVSIKGSYTKSGTTHIYDDSGELTGFTLRTSNVSGGWWMSMGSNISTKANVNNSHSGNGSTTVKYPMTTFSQAKTIIALVIDSTSNTYKLAVSGIEVNAEYTVTNSQGTTITYGPWVIPCPEVELPLPADPGRLSGSITQNVDGNMPGMTWDLRRY